jgi:hypothetical protein
MSPAFFFSGKLIRTPATGRPFLTTTVVLPLNTPEDFIAVERLPANDPTTPIWVYFQEKYDLLTRVLDEAFLQLAPLDQCLMTAMMPGGVRMPLRMLAADVFLVHSLEPERTRLLGEGVSLLTIEDSIVRHPLEYGTNEIQLVWYGPHANESAWVKFIDVTRSLGIKEKRET